MASPSNYQKIWKACLEQSTSLRKGIAGTPMRFVFDINNQITSIFVSLKLNYFSAYYLLIIITDLNMMR